MPGNLFAVINTRGPNWDDSEDKNEVEARLAPDCWVVKGLLRNLRIEPWELRLGSLDP